jgi:hypothetical protein
MTPASEFHTLRRTILTSGLPVNWFRSSPPDASDDSVRVKLGIPMASASKVSLVTSRTTCVNAVSALNTKRNEPNKVRQVWVHI